ncbi:MAG: hypothetical protein GF393_10645 [Armatimonadia bacterium]|nr:hypothetical protein [Armatimonadia bacterium]
MAEVMHYWIMGGFWDREPPRGTLARELLDLRRAVHHMHGALITRPLLKCVRRIVNKLMR